MATNTSQSEPPKADLSLESLARHLDQISPQMNAIGQGLARLEERFLLVTLFQEKEQMRTMLEVLMAVMAAEAELGPCPLTPQATRDVFTDEMWKAHKNKYLPFYSVKKGEFFDDCAAMYAACTEPGLLSNKGGMDAVAARIGKWSEVVCGKDFARRFTLPKNVVDPEKSK